MGISLDNYIQCWTLQLETNAEYLEAVQRRPTKMMKGLENKIRSLKTTLVMLGENFTIIFMHKNVYIVQRIMFSYIKTYCEQGRIIRSD